MEHVLHKVKTNEDGTKDEDPFLDENEKTAYLDIINQAVLLDGFDIFNL